MTIISVLIKLAIELEGLHEKAEIHGDIKPSNVLITANGLRIIDSLGLSPGVGSPALTPGWAAPEQILGKGVDFSTDQYPLGLMLCKFLGGVLYGEERTFLIPTGGSKLERFSLLRNPGVYLDPHTVLIDKEGISPLRNLIERCVQFNPKDRFPKLSELIESLKEANSKYREQGQLQMELNFGNLVMGQSEENEVSPMWLVNDIRG